MRDRWGGDPEVRLAATGFFRLHQTDQRWWFATPDGSAFVSHGLNHIEDNFLYQSYNRAYWAEQFGLPESAPMPAFHGSLQAKVQADYAYLGCNTLGCHSPVSLYPAPFVPYIHTLHILKICHWMTPTAEDFHDVFAPEYAQHCDRIAREQVAPRADDPYLIGYFITDTPTWTDEDAAPRVTGIYGRTRPGVPTWPRVLRNLGPDAPGKQAYVETMRARYGGDIAAFNAVYGTSFATFTDLLRAVDWRPQTDMANQTEKGDNLAFLTRVVDQSYRVICATIRRYDPNHLIFGDKLNGNTYFLPDDLIRLGGEHFDVAFYQFYGSLDEHVDLIERLYRLTGNPVFCGDSSVSTPDPRMPDPMGPQYPTQEERAAAFRELFWNTFSRPDFVGWNWCGWVDSWLERQPDKQHSGIQDPFGSFYPIAAAMREFSAAMYDIAIGSAPGPHQP
jgi:hypothetical protein